MRYCLCTATAFSSPLALPHGDPHHLPWLQVWGAQGTRLPKRGRAGRHVHQRRRWGLGWVQLSAHPGPQLPTPGQMHVCARLIHDASSTARRAVPDSRKAAALLIFGEHAREIITVECALWLSRVLIGDTAELLSWPELATAFGTLGVTPEQVEPTLKAWTAKVLDNLIVKVRSVTANQGLTSHAYVRACVHVCGVHAHNQEGAAGRRHVSEREANNTGPPQASCNR